MAKLTLWILIVLSGCLAPVTRCASPRPRLKEESNSTTVPEIEALSAEDNHTVIAKESSKVLSHLMRILEKLDDVPLLESVVDPREAVDKIPDLKEALDDLKNNATLSVTVFATPEEGGEATMQKVYHIKSPGNESDGDLTPAAGNVYGQTSPSGEHESSAGQESQGYRFGKWATGTRAKQKEQRGKKQSEGEHQHQEKGKAKSHHVTGHDRGGQGERKYRVRTEIEYFEREKFKDDAHDKLKAAHESKTDTDAVKHTEDHSAHNRDSYQVTHGGYTQDSHKSLGTGPHPHYVEGHEPASGSHGQDGGTNSFGHKDFEDHQEYHNHAGARGYTDKDKGHSRFGWRERGYRIVAEKEYVDRDRHHNKAYKEDKSEQGHRVSTKGRHGHKEGHEDIAKAKEHYEKGMHDSAHHERQHKDNKGSYDEQYKYGTIPSPPAPQHTMDHTSSSNAQVTALKTPDVPAPGGKKVVRIRVRQKNRGRAKEQPGASPPRVTVSRPNAKNPGPYREGPSEASIRNIPVPPARDVQYPRPTVGPSNPQDHYEPRSRRPLANKNNPAALNSVHESPLYSANQLVTNSRHHRIVPLQEEVRNPIPNVQAGAFQEQIQQGYHFRDNARGPPRVPAEVLLQSSEIPLGSGQQPPVHNAVNTGSEILTYQTDVIHGQPFAKDQYEANLAKYGGNEGYHEVQPAPDTRGLVHPPIPYQEYVLHGPQGPPLIPDQGLYRPQPKQQLFRTFEGRDIIIPSTSMNNFDVKKVAVPHGAPADQQYNRSLSEGIILATSLNFGNQAGRDTKEQDCTYQNLGVGPRKVVCRGRPLNIRASNDEQNTRQLRLARQETTDSNGYGRRNRPSREHGTPGQTRGDPMTKGSKSQNDNQNGTEVNDTVGPYTSSTEAGDVTLTREPTNEELEMARPVLESMGYILDLPQSPVSTPAQSEVKPIEASNPQEASNDFSQPLALRSEKDIVDDGRWYAKPQPG